ncbi:DUF7268 family protein [Haloarchaeobius sp. HRN-SO-5]|uniref:DUF7268 family protein n=1 Tax=Haloarchaeobius sp. HRN-SO-5 TaxID=3446118 RepID=UPI003EB95496
MNVVRRVRLVADALVAGVVVSVLAVLALLATGEPPVRAVETVFAVGALALGIGLLGWSGSVMAGRGVENMQDHMDLDSDWTETRSRRAMARISGFGGGLLVGSALLEVFAF